MSSTMVEPAISPPRAGGLTFYYGWVNVVMAAVAMSATLPGRTHGLGLISQPLLEDPTLNVDARLFADLNFWSVLLGSALCLPAGYLIDRFGSRAMMTLVGAGLGLAVIGMSRAVGVVALFIALPLIRGLGQGVLSLVSLALVGKWFRRRIGPAMGVNIVLMGIGFIAGIGGLGIAVEKFGWRVAWGGLGWCLLVGFVPLTCLLVRSTPESSGLPVDSKHNEQPQAALDMPLLAALRSPAFWAFTAATCLFNFVWSAITLFNEAILSEHDIDKETFVAVMGMLVATGIPTNLIAGWLAMRWPQGRLLLIGMLILAASLALFPFVNSPALALVYGALMGIAGGIITVVFFSVYGSAYGRGSLGRIQAVVQILSVFASALGPEALVYGHKQFGSYSPMFAMSVIPAVALGVVAWLTPRPKRPAEIGA